MKRLLKLNSLFLLGTIGIFPLSAFAVTSETLKKVKPAASSDTVPYQIKTNPDDTDIYSVPLDEDAEEEEELEQMTAPKKK